MDAVEGRYNNVCDGNVSKPSLVQEYNACNKRSTDLLRQIGDQGKQILAEQVRYHVLNGPKVPEWFKGFGWTQYTPYFNDGEPCEFSVNSCAADILICDRMPDEVSNFYDRYGYGEEASPIDVCGITFKVIGAGAEKPYKNTYATYKKVKASEMSKDEKAAYLKQNPRCKHFFDGTTSYTLDVVDQEYPIPDEVFAICNFVKQWFDGFRGPGFDNLFRAIFGDHCQVYMTLDGKFQVEEHDHE